MFSKIVRSTLLPLVLTIYAQAECIDDGAAIFSPQLDFDALFRTLDDRLVIDFPEWQSRYNQENSTDPSPAFANEDNCQNGLNDDDHLDLLAAVLDGEPVGTALAGLDPAEVASIRTGFANNRNRISGDLTFRVLGIVEVGIITIIEEQDPGFAEELKDLIAAYMTIGDAESVAFMRGFLITLSEIFIEQGVASGDIPAFVEGATKSAMRNAVNGNFVGSKYASFGDVSGTSSPNILGDTGNLDGMGDNNESTYAAVNGNRQAFMIGEGIAWPTIQILDFAGTTAVQSGERFDLTVVAPGGGTMPKYDWKKRNEESGVFERVGSQFALLFPYPLPSDAGDYLVVRCDEHWVRVSGIRTVEVTTKPFQIVSQPQSQTVNLGEDATFLVTVEGGVEIPAYQWFAGTSAGNLSAVSGADDNTLVFPSVTPADAGFYQVVAYGANKGGAELSSALVTLTVVDNPPLITLLGTNPVTIQCADEFVDAGATAEDDVDGDLTQAINVNGVVDPNTSGTYSLTYSVSDSGGNQASATRTVFVVDSASPTLTLWGATESTIECGTPFTDPGATAQDACDGDLSTVVSVTGNVDTTTPGQYALTYQVADRAENTAMATRTITVVDTTPPALTLIGSDPVTVACGSTYQETGAMATDVCDGDLTLAVQVAGVVDTSTPGEYMRTYHVMDAAGNDSTATRTVSVRDTTAPTLMLAGDTIETVACGSVYTDPGAAAEDACDGDLSAGIAVAGSVDTSATGEYLLTYSVTDSAGNEASVSRTVIVEDPAPPEITVLGANPLTLACGTPYMESGVTATDTCDGDLSGAVTLTGEVDSTTPGTYSVTYTVMDAAENTATATRTVEVVDVTAPTLNLVGADPMIVECGESFVNPGATASDACAGDLSADISVTGTVDSTVVDVYTLTYTVADPAGNDSEQTRTVQVVDRTLPNLELIGPDPLLLECGNPVSDPGAVATDICSGNLTAAITRTGVVDGSTPGTYTWTYTVTDGAENRATMSRTVEIADTTAPVLTLLGSNPLVVTCGETFTDPGVRAQDGCAGDLTEDVAIAGLVDTTTPGDYSITYTATDPTGNIASVSRDVQVRDTTPPAVTVLGANPLTLNCRQSWEDPGAGATDACTGDVTGSIVATDTVDTARPGTYRVTYRAVDSAGNEQEATRIVIVRDNCPLTFVKQPRDSVVYVGQSHRFFVGVVGAAGPQTFTWTRDGETVASGEAVVLTLPAVSETDAGVYQCTVSDGEQTAVSDTAILTVVAPASTGFHAADVNTDWVISLGELLRVVQFFNLTEVQCDANAEDGYGPGTGDRACAPHNSDFMPQDWRITVSELLRLVQFYNVPNGTYHAENGTEDGFAPGPG